ncbi:MAG TPA: xylulokinase [Steroidobacteraceae bacterium]|nr:xylulokinase [Steroidobacteraceae bacterium]
MYLGLDIGTSAVKAAVIDDTGSVVDQASSALEVSRPHPLWSEQNPADWWSAANNAVSDLRLSVRKAVRAIGLSGQMHGATLLNKQQRALRPAILWNDGRSAQQCAELEAAVPEMAKITGNRAMPGFTAPKLLWVREHEPEIFAEVAMVLLPKDYVRLRMTGEAASDMSDSAGTLWLDVAQRRWSEAMLAGTGLDVSHMPTVSEGNEISGELRAEIAEAWGMSRVPVVAGGGDNAAGAIGVGVVRPGDAFLSLGTSGVLFLANDGYRPNPAGGVHTFCHAVPKHWHQMSVILSAASCVDWAARLCNLGSAGGLFAAAEARSKPSSAEIFLPYLSGERTPHNDPNAQGVLYGLTHESSAASIAQAVLEGVAFAFRDGMDALLASGTKIDSIAVIGGGARSLYWGKILSSVLRRPLAYRDGGEVGPAYGAARLARLGKEKASIEEVCTPPPILHMAEPDDRLADLYAETLRRYRALYQNLKSSFSETRP